MRFSELLFVLMLLAVCACGYSARRGEVTLGGTERPGEQSIFVPIVDNVTVRTGAEAEFTNALRKVLSGVRGVKLVEREEDANFFLLGTLIKQTLVPRSSREGTEATSLRGGLAPLQSTAADLKLTVRLRVQLVEKVDRLVKREVWSREFESSAIFDASRRLEGSPGGIYSGAASAPHINDAREQIQTKRLAESLAQLVFDQVTQDF